VFGDEGIGSKIIVESKVSSPQEFSKTMVKPKKYEKMEEVEKAFEKAWNLKRITFFTKKLRRVPTFGEILRAIRLYQDKNANKPLYKEVFEGVERFVREFMRKNNLEEGDRITKEFIEEFVKTCEEESQKVHTRSEEYTWLTGRKILLESLEGEEEVEGITLDGIIDLIENPEIRLICLSISEPEIIKKLAIDISTIMLLKRKREFRTTPQVLFVFDEAQEFVAAPTQVSGIDKQCSLEIEKLLRQGRKYGLGSCIATQRIAYLNTNVLQQLHTYFVSTLPRSYDRSTVSNQFMIDRNVVDKVLEFVPGDWLLSSYVATGMCNVPIFIKSHNAEDTIDEYLKQFSLSG
jgi:hypothetical protein